MIWNLSGQWKKGVELVALFIMIPVFYWRDWIPVHKIVPLVLLLAYCVFILIRKNRINKDRFVFMTDWKLILFRFLILEVLIFVGLYFYNHQLFADFDSNPKLFYMVLMYPFLSAFPQELIFREFFFYRYSTIFRNPLVMLASNTLLFTFAHLYFANWIVIAFTLVGGVIFSLTYLKSKSLLVVTIEHSLYGVTLLCSGLAEYFYKAF